MQIIPYGDDILDMKRAKEIFASYGVIDVEYKNKPVWIENVDSKTETVSIKYLDNENKTETVHPENLTEK